MKTYRHRSFASAAALCLLISLEVHGDPVKWFYKHVANPVVKAGKHVIKEADDVLVVPVVEAGKHVIKEADDVLVVPAVKAGKHVGGEADDVLVVPTVKAGKHLWDKTRDRVVVPTGKAVEHLWGEVKDEVVDPLLKWLSSTSSGSGDTTGGGKLYQQTLDVTERPARPDLPEGEYTLSSLGLTIWYWERPANPRVTIHCAGTAIPVPIVDYTDEAMDLLVFTYRFKSDVSGFDIGGPWSVDITGTYKSAYITLHYSASEEPSEGENAG